MVPMVPERRSVACLSQVLGGERHAVSLEHLAGLCDRETVAEALRPHLQRLQEAEAAEIPRLWASLEHAALVLSELTGEETSALALSAADRERAPGASSESRASSWERDATATLDALAKGAPAAAWASRLAYCVQVEAHGGSKSASACAQRWLQRSLPVLPWILAWLMVPVNLAALRQVRGALEFCEDAQALSQLRDVFVTACTLLLRAAWFQTAPGYSHAVAWLTSVLVAAHEACQILLPEIPAGAVAAAIAVSGPWSTEIQSPPWEAVLGEPAFALHICALPGLSSEPTCAPAPDELSDAVARAVHQEVTRVTESDRLPGEGWPGKIAPLLLLFRLLPDAGGSPLLAQARLMALRALRSSSQAVTENQLFDFLQDECGHGHTVLRHLAEVLRARDSAARGVFRVTLISAAAAAGLGLQACESPNSLCDFIRSEQDGWAEAYLAQYPHRRLVWQPLGEAEILWRHAKGETLLVLSEPQAHALLSVARLELPELPELPLAEPWAALAGPLGPLELDVDARAVRLRTACDAPRLDLTTLPEMVRAKEPERSREVHAPIVDAALVRILKRFHVLTVEEVLVKLATYPDCLEMPGLTSPAFALARAAAEDGEALGRLRSLCERGLLRAEGDLDSQSRLFYEN
ncbi:unnamed protein product [Effrenium voratum]|uniref:Uncharacterized protein n=1 Tax=Effrenium voratum TaxID=2562239 RepID=A0AA36J2V0_9DINO|nr:unnamed protein product [Effrenium voratum]CAJ1451341.1 unnamed protein product [Effrenium voratum]